MNGNFAWPICCVTRNTQSTAATPALPRGSTSCCNALSALATAAPNSRTPPSPSTRRSRPPARPAAPGFAQHRGQTVRASPVVGSDETSARVKGKNWWQRVVLSFNRRPSTDPDSRGAAVLSDFRKLAQGYLQMPWRSLSFRHSSRCPRHQQRLRAVRCGTASHLPQMPAPATAGVTGGFRPEWGAHTYATPPRSSPPARLHGHSASRPSKRSLAGRPVLMPP